jgi:hypothetical protein
MGHIKIKIKILFLKERFDKIIIQYKTTSLKSFDKIFVRSDGWIESYTC